MAKERTIKFLRGNLGAMPILADGEPAFALDTNQLFIGDGGINRLIGFARISPGNYGDITVDVLGTTWTINNGAITAVKLAAVTSHRLLGRKAATDGTAQEVSIDEALQFYAPAVGDFLAFNGSSFVKIHPARANDAVEAQLVSGNMMPKFVSKGYILLAELNITTTNGGTFTSGAWQTRLLNRLLFDTGGDCALVGNQFTLVAGTYDVRASAPAAGVNSHAARLRNITDGTTIASGTCEFAGSGVQSNSLISTRFTIAATKTIALEHQCQTTVATLGMGIGNAFSPSQFSFVEILRVA